MRTTLAPSSMSRLVNALFVVLAAAMIACWGHLVTAWILRHVVGLFSWKWWLRDQLLLLTVGYTLVFAALSALPIALHVGWPRVMTLARLAAFEVALAVLSVLLLLQRIAPWALCIIALAIAVEFLRRQSGEDARIVRWSRVATMVGMTASAVLVAAVVAKRELSERSELRELATAPSGTPNVLLLILDTVRASSLGLYGGPADNVPHLTARAQSGVVFDNAYSTASWTLPSHASIFTGHYASHTGADWRAPLGLEYSTLAEVLGDRGFATGGFVANSVAAWYRTGLARGFMRYEDTKLSLTQALLSTTLTQSRSILNAYIKWRTTGRLRVALRQLRPFSLVPHGNYLWNDQILAEDVADDFLDWQGGLDGRPFFAFLNLFDAHDPYLPPPRYRALYGAPSSSLNRYLGGIRYMDDTIDEILKELEARGVLNNTIVVVTSDHGESFGEHSLSGHGNGLYREQIRVPLVIFNGKGLPAGSHVRTPVSLRDLASTIMALTGSDTQHPLGGRSLTALWDSEGGTCAHPSPVIAEVSRGINVNRRSFVGRADQKTLVDDTVQVIQSSLETLSLFHLQNDSLQLRDLATQPDARNAGRAMIDRTLRAHGIAWSGRGTPTTCPDAAVSCVPRCPAPQLGPASRDGAPLRRSSSRSD